MVNTNNCDDVLVNLTDRKLRLRKICEEDCELLWQWANDPEVRIYSFSSAPIPWHKHAQWFTHKLKDVNCHIFVALDSQERPIGQIRFDNQDDLHTTVSLSLDKDSRGLGYGISLIEIGIQEIFRSTTIKTINAFIKPHNLSSIKAFEKAHFYKLRETTIQGNPALHYVRIKNDNDD